MSATDLATVIIAVAALAAVGLLVWLVFELRRTADELSAVLGEVRQEMERSGRQSDAIDAELRRAGGLLDTAERVSARADTLSKVTYGAVAKPVIKTAAVVRGTGRAARRLRRGVGDDTFDSETG